MCKKVVLAGAFGLTCCFEIAGAAEIAIGGSTVAFDYMETANGSNLDSETSSLLDVKGGYVALRFGGRNQNGVKFINDVEYSYLKGNTDYVGAYLFVPGSSYGDVVSQTDNKIQNTTFKLGISLPITKCISVGGQAGAGWREWERSLSDGNVETYDWTYWIAGARADVLTEIGEFSLYGNWQKAVKPEMYASSIGTNFELGSTSGYEAGVKWSAKFSTWAALELEYVYDYWKIGKSDVVNGFYEPDSKTKNQYVKAGLAFIF